MIAHFISLTLSQTKNLLKSFFRTRNNSTNFSAVISQNGKCSKTSQFTIVVFYSCFVSYLQ